MQLTHTFEIAAPVDQVFDVFGRLDLLAPCFPGASVWGRDGEVYHGAVKIKFGPFPLVFEGTARVVRADLAERRLVVKANARDRRGAAAGAATVTATFSAKGSDRTWVEVATDLDLTGRPAQLGSGAISSVSDRLADQFVGCIGAKLAAGLTASEDLPEETPDQVAGDATAPAARGPLRPEYAYRPPTTSESAPHLQVLPDVARTWLPWVGGAVGGVAVLVLLVRWLRRR
jgi:carbon monoxide dehydrogenase subunit G